jgi:hypothetical protein
MPRCHTRCRDRNDAAPTSSDPPPDRHNQHIREQIAGDVCAHRPADHPARARVEDHGHLESAVGRPDIDEVPAPLRILSIGAEVSIEGVGGKIVVGRIPVSTGRRSQRGRIRSSRLRIRRSTENLSAR